MPALLFEDTLGNDPCIDIDINSKRDAFSYLNAGTNKFRITKDGYMYTTSGWGKRYLSIGLGDLAADSDAFDYPLFRANVPVTIANVEVGTDTTAAANSTNYATLDLFKTGSTTAIATALSTSGTAFTLHVPRAFTSISSTLGKLAVGETLYISPTKGGSGIALSGVVVSITFTIDIPEAESGTATDNVIRIVNGEAGSDGLVESDHLMRDHLRIKRNGETVLTIDVDGVILPGTTYTPVDQYYFEAVNVGTIVEADGAAKKSVLMKPNGTVKIEKIYFGVNTTVTSIDDTNYIQVIIRDGSGNVLTDGYIGGPTTEDGLTQGYLYSMGDISAAYAVITSSEQIQAEYVTAGTVTVDAAGLTFVVVYRKLD
ncbi:MAG: hypothetical protein Q7J73_00675 [Dehalococcoidales bacterium]|nr:hypothetical protein [Dehalococcoidales bacterium]